MKEIDYSPTEGADAGKIFVIRRMSAFAADRWARNLVRALARAGQRTPDEALQVGIAGLSGQSMALFGNLEKEDCEEAFQALLDCVLIRRGGDQRIEPAPILEIDIEDANTLPSLRTEAFKLNMDFFKAAIYQIFPMLDSLMESGINHP